MEMRHALENLTAKNSATKTPEKMRSRFLCRNSDMTGWPAGGGGLGLAWACAWRAACRNSDKLLLCQRDALAKQKARPA